MLLNIPQCTGQPPLSKVLVQNVHSATGEKPCSDRMETHTRHSNALVSLRGSPGCGRPCLGSLRLYEAPPFLDSRTVITILGALQRRLLSHVLVDSVSDQAGRKLPLSSEEGTALCILLLRALTPL